MKRIKVIFIFFSVSFLWFSIPSTSKENTRECLKAVREGGSVQLSFVFTEAPSGQPEQINLFNQTRDLAPPSVALPESPVSSFENVPAPYRIRKAQAEKDFLLAFQRRDKIDMSLLIEQFPFLKGIRFTDPSLLEEISEFDRHWCPKGWSPLQIASYRKDSDMLDFLLTIGMDFRTKKRQGGESLESNPLHIAIRRDFKEGAKRILSHAKFIPFGTRNRFIDEKDHRKKTPWCLAVQKDRQNQILRYTNIVGSYEPSGLVKCYTLVGAKDGFQIAIASQEWPLIRQAYRYLVAPDYDSYRHMREEYPHIDLKPPP